MKQVTLAGFDLLQLHTLGYKIESVRFYKSLNATIILRRELEDMASFDSVTDNNFPNEDVETAYAILGKVGDPPIPQLPQLTTERMAEIIATHDNSKLAQAIKRQIESPNFIDPEAFQPGQEC